MNTELIKLSTNNGTLEVTCGKQLLPFKIDKSIVELQVYVVSTFMTPDGNYGITCYDGNWSASFIWNDLDGYFYDDADCYWPDLFVPIVCYAEDIPYGPDNSEECRKIYNSISSIVNKK